MKRTANYLLVSLGLVMAISACKSNQGGEKIIAIDVANIDTSVRPQDDFYSYANGLWLKNNPIPSTETRWGAFSILQDQTNKKLKVLFLAPHLSTGGMPSFLLKRIESLQKYSDLLELFVVEYSNHSDYYVVQKTSRHIMQTSFDKSKPL